MANQDTKPARFSFCRNADDDNYSVHADGCAHLTRKGRWQVPPVVYLSGAASVQDAIDRGLNDEVVALGYGLDYVKVQSCCRLTAAEKRALVDPRDVRICPGCKKPWNATKGCNHDDGCLDARRF